MIMVVGNGVMNMIWLLNNEDEDDIMMIKVKMTMVLRVVIMTITTK